MHLELDHLSLAFLVTSQFEVLATFQRRLFAVFALGAFHTKYDFLGGLSLKTTTKKYKKISLSFIFDVLRNLSTMCGFWIAYLLSEDRFGLTSETLLFTVVTTTSLGCWAFLGLLVLCHFVQLVALAFLAECATLFWYIHLNNWNENHRNKWLKFIRKSTFPFVGHFFLVSSISTQHTRHSVHRKHIQRIWGKNCENLNQFRQTLFINRFKGH